VGPGRVNLIGDHTDYNQGRALPMAIGLGVTVTYAPTADAGITVVSDAYPGEQAAFPMVTDPDTILALEPAWARLCAAVASLARPDSGGNVHISSSLPRGSGLSSSAALAVALADVLGVEGDAGVIARLCQTAEHRIGVPVGLMDPLVCAGGRAGHALWIDRATDTTRQVQLPKGAQWTVVDSGQRRDLRTSPYALRVAECEAAAAVVGPLGRAGPDDLPGLRDPLLRRRARHVIGECARVDACALALERGDLASAGALMDASHASLTDEFEATTPEVDDLVAQLRGRPGVLGVRMTGAGWGGCVVAIGEPGALDGQTLGAAAWTVTPVDGTVARRRLA
jgi:galactokinase